jgi:5-methylcytosine-specific restriction enzyme A
MGKFDHLYYQKRWRRLRQYMLARAPLCAMCQQAKRVALATVVDHKQPHKGNMHLFWNVDNLQCLCTSCHNSIKQRIDRTGHDRMIGDDGWPIQRI